MPGFGLDDVRSMTVTLRVEGPEGFVLEGSSSIAKISRDPADLVAQMVNAHHRYPDGAVLFLGTMFAPVQDRDAPGQGFTHRHGDIVTVAAPRLGRLVNRMMPTDRCEAWTLRGRGADAEPGRTGVAEVMFVAARSEATIHRRSTRITRGQCGCSGFAR